MATLQQDLTAFRIKTDRIEGELRNMITRDNLQDVVSEAQRRFVDDGMWKDLAVAEVAKIRNEVGEFSVTVSPAWSSTTSGGHGLPAD